MASGSPSHVHSYTPFLGFVSQDADLEALKAFAIAQGWTDACVHSGNIATAAEFLANHSSPQVLVVELPSADAAPGLLDKLADVCDPGTKVIATGKINEYSFYCWLTDIGIFSYLLQPLSESSLQNVWQKATAPTGPVEKKAKEPARIYGFMGSRGGSGASSVAILMAAILAEQGNKKIALVDLDPQDGSISLFLDLEPSRGLREALEKPDRIDSLFLDRVMVKTGKGLHVLSTEDAYSEQVHYHDHAAETLIQTLKEKFDVVLLDLPKGFSTFSRNAVKQCESVFVVCEPTLQSLRDAMRLNDLFRDALKIKPPRFIVNRIGMAPKFEIGMAEFEKGLGAKAECQLPFSPDIFMQMGPDIPALKNAAAPAVKALRQLADTILPSAEADAEDAPKKKALPNFFKKK